VAGAKCGFVARSGGAPGARPRAGCPTLRRFADLAPVRRPRAGSLTSRRVLVQSATRGGREVRADGAASGGPCGVRGGRPAGYRRSAPAGASRRGWEGGRPAVDRHHL